MIVARRPLISDFWQIRGSGHPESRLERCPSGHNIGVAVAGKGGGQVGLASPSRQLIAKVPCSLMILDHRRGHGILLRSMASGLRV